MLSVAADSKCSGGESSDEEYEAIFVSIHKESMLSRAINKGRNRLKRDIRKTKFSRKYCLWLLFLSLIDIYR